MHFEVLFAMLPDAAAQGVGFGVDFEWDLPLLDGYPWSVLENISASPGMTHFRGCDTPGIRQELQAREIDAVVVNGWVVKTCLQALRASRQLGIPCIVRGEANDLRPRPWWKRVIQRQLVRRFSAWLPIGKASRNFYRGYGVPEDRMFDARYCIENERFERAAAEHAGTESAIRDRFQIPADRTCFMFCGKFEHKKHPLELIHAVKKAIAAGADFHLMMVGDGELRTQCEQFVGEHKLPVTFTGFLNQSEIVQSYIAADALVLPSDHGETWGLVVNEGMACGLPAIVSSQVGCAADLISEGQTGWTFPFGDWEKLAELLQTISGRRSDIAGMAEACRERIAAYSPRAAAEGIAAAVHYVTGTSGNAEHESVMTAAADVQH